MLLQQLFYLMESQLFTVGQLKIILSVVVPLLTALAVMARWMLTSFERRLNQQLEMAQTHNKQVLENLRAMIEMRFRDAEEKRKLAGETWRVVFENTDQRVSTNTDLIQKNSELIREIHTLVLSHYTPVRDFDGFRAEIIKRLEQIEKTQS